MTDKYRPPCQDDIQNPARRRVIQTLLVTGAALAVPALQASVRRVPERSLEFRNLHTGEMLRTAYWVEGRYLQDELNKVNQVLRDHRSGEVHPMDKRLLDLLYVLQQTTGTRGAFHIISGYRSPQTNQKLRAQSSGVAKRSLHMQGRAVDIRLPGCELKHLRDAALSLKAGGVGFYARSDFIHVDTGRVRRW
ncbi:MAG TPA: DUF882 domain-containing protein [Gammaproteobacteria bacterium]|nr:DUF882 domain-containing protein [Gammaproteobacteria bacterium]